MATDTLIRSRHVAHTVTRLIALYTVGVFTSFTLSQIGMLRHWQRHLATVRLLLTRYIRERARILPPRLLQTDELIRRFHLTPGPLIGQLLEQIAEAQAEGRVNSKEDALWLVEDLLQQHHT